MAPSPSVLVRVEHLVKLFPVAHSFFQRARHFVHAVDDVSFEVHPQEIFGLVGESGCGKTTTGKLLLKLVEPTQGHIRVHMNSSEESLPRDREGYVDVARLRSHHAVKEFRRHVQMIFQDPYESLNPRMTISDIIAEPLKVQGVGNPLEREARVAEMLKLVGLSPPGSFLFRYPHELSGGQRQRVSIARAMILNPSFIVADEPTSMLDVSIRAGIMNLMLELKEEFQISYLYITHDLAVARYVCDRMAVMYLGKVVEMGPTEAVIQNPLHPYTKALISAVPVPDPRVKRATIEIKGGVPRPIDPEPQCRFLNRCPLATDHCRAHDHPPLEEKEPGHWAACYEA
jgi:peptide/nickel transport system ATP-binding protein